MSSALSRSELLPPTSKLVKSEPIVYRAERILRTVQLWVKSCDTLKAMEIHSCLKTLVAGKSAEIRRLSLALTPRIPPQRSLFFEFHGEYLKLPSEENVFHRTA